MEGSNLLEAARAFIDDERGLTSVEYAILLGLFIAAIFGAWQTFGTVLGDSSQADTDIIADIETP